MSNVLNEASLVLIPSGYKAGKVYSQIPENGNGDFTFSRDGAGASPATRVNASGLIEKGRTNELTYSNDFSNWTSANTTETSGQSGYDGTNDAWLLSKVASAGNIQLSVSTSGVNTFSYYAKAGTLNWTRLLILGSTNASTYINLSDGSIGVGGGGFIDVTATSVGGGWYRVSITHSTTITQVRIYPADTDDNTSGTSGNIYIQDAQLEQGLVATDYIETTTAAVSAGLLGDMPRLDYSGGATCPSLLLEPSRTNVFTDSEYFNGADWILQDATITNNAAISPEGVQNASLYTTSSDLYDFVRQNIAFVSGTTYTYSVFAKQGTSSQITLAYSSAAFSSSPSVEFDLSDGTYTIGSGSPSVKMEDYGNGWYRCAITDNATTSTTRSTGFSSTASGAVTTLYLYGAQLEASASYPTSYIPTYGSASTRGADACFKTGISSLIGQTEGTLYWDFDAQNTGGYSSGFFTTGVDDGSYNNAVGLVSNSPSDTQLRGIYRVGGSTGYLGSSFDVTSQRNKIAIVWTSSNIKMFKNGVLETTLSKSSFSASMGSFYFPTTGRSGHYNANQIISFTTALTDSEAIALTTL